MLDLFFKALELLDPTKGYSPPPSQQPPPRNDQGPRRDQPKQSSQTPTAQYQYYSQPQISAAQPTASNPKTTWQGFKEKVSKNKGKTALVLACVVIATIANPVGGIVIATAILGGVVAKTHKEVQKFNNQQQQAQQIHSTQNNRKDISKPQKVGIARPMPPIPKTTWQGFKEKVSKNKGKTALVVGFAVASIALASVGSIIVAAAIIGGVVAKSHYDAKKFNNQQQEEYQQSLQRYQKLTSPNQNNKYIQPLKAPSSPTVPSHKPPSQSKARGGI